MHLGPPVVQQGADFPEVNPAYHRISISKGAVLHQYGGDRAPAGINFGFDDMAVGQFICVGFQFQNLRLQRDHLKQFVDTLVLLCRNMDKDRVAPPVFGGQPVFGQFPLNPVRIGVGLVNFVYGNNNRHLGRF